MGRRRKNPLLGKIIIASIALHVIIVPIAARFGAFQKIQRQFTGPVTIVPPPKDEKPPPPKEAAKKAAEPVKKAAGPAKQAAPALNQPKVAASSAPAETGTGGPVVNPNGTAKAGSVPTPAGTGGTGTAPNTQPKENPVSTAPKEKPTPPVVQPKPETSPEQPKTHIPVLVAAESEGQPTIDIPDDLREDALDKTAVVLVTVLPSGAAGSVSMVSGTGTAELDDLALNAARKWKFKPATRDGEAVQGKARLHIHFSVN